MRASLTLSSRLTLLLACCEFRVTLCVVQGPVLRVLCSVSSTSRFQYAIGNKAVRKGTDRMLWCETLRIPPDAESLLRLPPLLDGST
eukprot:1158017-Prymnesium_polylepis.1